MVLRERSRKSRTAVKNVPNTTSYTIEKRLYSQPACLFFARRYVGSQPLVIKILRSYQDPRYRLKSRSERQACQLEALQWNTMFANDVYVGLASVLQETEKTITLGKIIKSAEEASSLDSSCEYALIMKRLPENQQLSCLLEHGSRIERQHYIQVLTECVVGIHQSKLPLSEEKWGSFKFLFDKLTENLELVTPLETTIQPYNPGYCIYNKIIDIFFLRGVKKTFIDLKEAMLKIIKEGQYEEKFAKRVEMHHIHRCHGDLKASNIWIMENDTVQILDAIDFNPMFCNIDILSDFAMLVIDVQVRTHSKALANSMIERYLEKMQQTDEDSRAVLAYYLVEKAFVGAAISIMYDKEIRLGLQFLKVAKQRMRELEVHTFRQKQPDLSFAELKPAYIEKKILIAEPEFATSIS